MGSQQSQPSQPAEGATQTETNPASIKQRQEESGYALAARKCRKKQRLYDACYTAALSSKEEDCEELFETYRTCFLKWMSKDMRERGVQVSENSMVGDFLEEEADEDR